MADHAKSSTASNTSPTFDHQPSDVTHEINGLRAEIAELKALIAEKTGEAYGSVAESASGAATYVSSQASSVAGTIKAHPAATTTLVTLIGAVGFAIGYIVANAIEEKEAWYRRYLTDRF